MQQRKFRKVPGNLPREPIVDQRPWSIAGLLLALIVLIIMICSYFERVSN